MQILHKCCCGLDVHKRFVVACLIRYGEDGKQHKELQRFATLQRCTHRLSYDTLWT